MNRSATRYLLILLITGIGFGASAQTDSARLISITTKLQQHTANNPVEKVYLHFNKPAYLAGDTIWFKAYLTVGPLHKPSALSGVLYVELIGSNDKIVSSLKLKVAGGVAAGDIPVADAIATGSYRIRAYTNWMLNSAPDYFFEKKINIGTSKTNAVFITTSVKVADSKVNAELVYTNIEGRPYAGKTVTYEVKADTLSVLKATGITDSKGIVKITFPEKGLNNKKANGITSRITIVKNLTVDKAVPLVLQDEGADIQFFPEGGQFVAGIRSKLAFKVIGSNGLGLNVKGTVFDNNHNEVAYFTAQHAGMGFFGMMPQPGKTYSAKITLPDSTVRTVKLPDAVDKGFLLAVNSNDSLNLQVRIACNTATYQEKQNTSLYLVGQCAGKVYYTTFVKLDNTVFSAIIPKNRFPSGIVQFTLFSANMEPLNERVVFLQNADKLNISIITDKAIFAPMEKVKMTVSAKDKENKPSAGSFSLSVFNEDRVPVNENVESTILSDILLTADLRGYVEEPNYYFNDASDKTRADLDVLMLTQGYRRFDWRAVLAGQEPQLNYLPEKALEISGTVISGANKPIANGKVTVIASKENVIIDTVTDAQGKFRLHNLEFADGTKLMVQGRKANDGKNVNVFLDGRTVPLVNKSTKTGDESLTLLPLLSAQADSTAADTTRILETLKGSDNLKKNNNLKQVDIKAKRGLNPDEYNQYGAVSQYKVKMEQMANYNDVFEGLHANIPGISYKNGVIYYEGNPVRARVNGIFYRQNYLEIFDPKDVESIYIVNASTVEGRPSPIAWVTTKAYAGTDTIRLKQVDIQGTGKSKANANAPWVPTVAHSSNLNGGGQANQVLTGAQLENYANVVDGIAAKGTDVLRSGDTFTATRTHRAVSFMVDGMAVSSIDNISADNVESVEILTSNAYKSIYGSSIAAGGVILVNTRKGATGNPADTIKLKTVDIKGQKSGLNKNGNSVGTPVVEHSDNLNGPGHADMVFGAKQLENCVDFLSCVMSKIPGVDRVQNENGVLYYFTRRKAQSVTSPPPIQFMLDGLQLNAGNLSALESINVNTVSSVEVLNSGGLLAMYGQQASGGLIIITTKKGTEGDNNSFAYASVPGVAYTTFSGFYKARQFYLPKYTPQQAARVNDTRTAIYWNPYLLADKNGALQVDFFNPGVGGSYRAVIEGIDDNGNIGRYVYRYRVE